MKIFTLLFSLLFLASCGTTENASAKAESEVENVVEEIEEVQEEVGNESLDVPPSTQYFMGTVSLKDGCEVSISSKDFTQKLYPVGLAEMFKVEGARISFSFTPSRAPLPEGCESCKAVVLDNVTRIKG